MARPKKWDEKFTTTITMSGRAHRAWKATGLPFGDWLEGLVDRKGVAASDPEHMLLQNLEAQLAHETESHHARKDALELQIEALRKRQADGHAKGKSDVRDVLDRAKGKKDHSTPSTQDDEQET